MKPRTRWLVLFAALSACLSPTPESGKSGSLVPNVPLSAYATDPEPWAPFEPNSDMRQPVYMGASPVEMTLDGKLERTASLPAYLRKLGEAQLLALAGELDAAGSLEFEGWPAEDDYGWQLTLALARWRSGPGKPWRWLSRDNLKDDRQPDHDVPLLLPLELDPADADDHAPIFADFLELPSLYDRPVFSECIWTDPGPEGRVITAWMAPSEREAFGRSMAAAGSSRHICRALRQPARIDARPISFILKVQKPRLSGSVSTTAASVTWPKEITWIDESDSKPTPSVDSTHSNGTNRPRIQRWPDSFAADYRRDLLALDGEEEAVFPRSGRRMRFTRKSSAQPDHQLEDVAGYLEERYAELGIQTRRQSFDWRGLRQTNVIAILPGTEGGGDAPLLVADHYDTAFADAHFKKTGQRIAVPGADDNASGSAALLRAADLLRTARRRHELWLVHLTGEEYPGDDLGARYLADELIRARHRIKGILFLDMIAFCPGPAQGALFQISTGDSPESIELGSVAMAAAVTAAPELKAVLRLRHDRRSYLYNTDGHIYSQLGYPVLLINEHINGLENLDRPHYHELTDKSDTLNWEYAVSVTKVAIEALARLIEAEGL